MLHFTHSPLLTPLELHHLVKASRGKQVGMFIHFFSSLIMKKFSKRVEKTKVTRKDEHFLRKKKINNGVYVKYE